jgi:glycosyltransferase involved in cell wall biosynthesis
MNNIWIDLTDFTIWRGIHTGTQRVVYQIATFLKENPEVRFCSYEYTKKQYIEVSFNNATNGIDSTEGDTKINKTHLSKSIKSMRRTYDLLMPPIASKSVSRLKNSKNLANNQNIDIAIEVDFKKDDTLLVLGGNWDKQGFIEALLLVKKSGVKLVHNINDLIPIFDKGHVSSDEHERFEKYMKQVIENSDLLTAISNYTKKDIEKYCKQNKIICPPVYVMRLGDNPISATPKTIKGIEDSFILSVSTIELRKNHTLLYYAYKEAINQKIELPKLVIAGKRGWLTGDLQYMLAHDPEIKDKITIVESPGDDELAWLYKNCLFSVYPSYYEGWGLPVAESIMYGKFCLATNTTSVPEVAGDLLDYFSPFDSGDCLQGIVKLLDDSYRKSKVNNLTKSYKTTSWENTANSLYLELKTI